MKTRWILLAAALLVVATSCSQTASESKQDTSTKVYQAPALGYEYQLERKALSSPSYSGDAVKEEEIAYPPHNTESYAYTPENTFQHVKDHPLSTFSIDVDNASYTNTRRYLEGGSLPPADAVRIEEFINYFQYDYPQTSGPVPFAIHTELAGCPWNAEHHLMMVTLKGKSIPFESMAPLNVTFLLDVSGSMSDENKLPLLKKSLGLLVEKLRPKDKISIVVYAGAAGVVLEPSNNKEEILSALNRLEAGGSTAGGQGIQLAYEINKKHFIENGNNRIILATDGDFNIGASSDGEMTRLIESKRDQGIYITVLGFGMGNYKDSKMETIADHGNGNYFYIDTYEEARKVLYTQLDGTLYSIANDVKLQLEFNPAKVASYRLIGYENRMLKSEDFNNDKKDAGELGAGHTVTALYELVPAGKNQSSTAVDPLKYQKQVPVSNSQEWLTVKFRYKVPKDTVSKLLVKTETGTPKPFMQASENMRFASSIAGFGMLLRGSEFLGTYRYPELIQLAQSCRGKDEDGYRAELVQLMKTAEQLQSASLQRNEIRY